MSRKPRIWYEGAIYHIINRGNNQQEIFYDDKDRLLFSEKLMKVCREHGCSIHAYCLMTNHYHLLLETTVTHIAKTMHLLHTYYAKQFNNKYGKSGQLFQERYRSILVEKDSYLLGVSRYIHLNPVDAGLVNLPENYRFSSLKSYLDKPSFLPITVHTDFILNYFDWNSNNRKAEYLKFVHDQLGKDSSLEHYITEDDILGSENFVKEVKAKYTY